MFLQKMETSYSLLHLFLAPYMGGITWNLTQNATSSYSGYKLDLQEHLAAVCFQVSEGTYPKQLPQ